MKTIKKTKTQEPFVAERSIHEALEMVTTLNSEDAVAALLTLLKYSYLENRELCNKLIESDDQLIDFLSCEDWSAVMHVKGQYKLRGDWSKLRDEYKSILNALKASTQCINANLQWLNEIKVIGQTDKNQHNGLR